MSRVPAILCAACLLLAARAAAAADSPEALLKEAQAMTAAFSDLSADLSITLQDGAAKRESTATFLAKGDRRLVRFTGPADLKGTGILTDGGGAAYVALPAFGNRIRRLSTKGTEGFLNLGFVVQDIAAVDLPALYDAKVASSGPEGFVLDLALKPGAEAAVPRMKVHVDRRLGQVVRIDALDAAGATLRTQTRTGFAKDPKTGKVVVPAEIRVVEPGRGNRTTIVRLSNVKVDAGVPDEAVGKRALARDE